MVGKCEPPKYRCTQRVDSAWIRETDAAVSGLLDSVDKVIVGPGSCISGRVREELRGGEAHVGWWVEQSVSGGCITVSHGRTDRTVRHTSRHEIATQYLCACAAAGRRSGIAINSQQVGQRHLIKAVRSEACERCGILKA